MITGDLLTASCVLDGARSSARCAQFGESSRKRSETALAALSPAPQICHWCGAWLQLGCEEPRSRSRPAPSLAHNAPRCVRCKTRYCDATCQHDHWRRGHKQMCKKIHRGGNAEQYNADKKYKEAVAEAVEACADDRAFCNARERRSTPAKRRRRRRLRGLCNGSNIACLWIGDSPESIQLHVGPRKPVRYFFLRPARG